LTADARAQSAREEAVQQAIETVALGGSLSSVLEFLCRTMEEESRDGVIACIHPLDETSATFCDTVAPSLPKSYSEAVDGMLISSLTGPCCYAAVTRQTVVVPEVAADPKWSKFQAFAEPLGVRACWSTPIFSTDKRVIGTFAHYYREARDPSPRDERMVKLLTRAAAIAIERSRGEAKLRELNETLEQRVEEATRERLEIWNASQDLLVLGDLEGRVLSVNPAWSATLGWPEADLVGRTTDWLLHPDDLERVHAEIVRLGSGLSTSGFESRLRHKDGSYRRLSWKAVPDGGRLYATGRDVTELKEAEDRLHDTRRELAQVARHTTLAVMTGSIAHEMNQPLAAIVACGSAALRFLDRAEPDLDEARDALRQIVDDGHRAAAIISNIRELFRRDDRAPVPLDANELVREVLSLTYSDLVARRVTVQHELQEGLPQILGQRVLLQQVLLNLVANAVEAMAPLEQTARLLAVKTQARGPDSVLISLADSGPGIDPEVAKRIFDPFFSTKPQGMGMGLSICRMIVESHQGRLWMDAAVPQGAIFNLQLPTSGSEAARSSRASG